MRSLITNVQKIGRFQGSIYISTCMEVKRKICSCCGVKTQYFEKFELYLGVQKTLHFHSNLVKTVWVCSVCSGGLTVSFKPLP